MLVSIILSELFSIESSFLVMLTGLSVLLASLAVLFSLEVISKTGKSKSFVPPIPTRYGFLTVVLTLFPLLSFLITSASLTATVNPSALNILLKLTKFSTDNFIVLPINLVTNPTVLLSLTILCCNTMLLSLILLNLLSPRTKYKSQSPNLKPAFLTILPKVKSI